MALQRQFNILVYQNDGTFVTSLTDTDLKSSIKFTSKINGGLGQLVLDLNLPWDDFGEGSTIDHMYYFKIYSVVVRDGVQTSYLIYTGFVSKYEPYIEKSGDEGVNVTLLGLVSLLSFSYYKDGSNFTVTHTNEDPEDIMKAIVDHHLTIYTGSLISYSDDEMSAVGTNVTKKFEDKKWFDALDETSELGGAGWWWMIRDDGQLWFKEKPSEATHHFTIGKDIEFIKVNKSSEKVLNDLQLRWSDNVPNDYVDDYDDSASIAAYGKRSDIQTSSVQNEAGADQEGEKKIADEKDDKVGVELAVNTNYPIETIKCGDTCRILNHNDTTVLNDNMQIVKTTYEMDVVRIELEDFPSDFIEEMRSLV